MRAFHSRLFQQNTIQRVASIEGVGIHTGQTTSLRLLPAPSGTGIIFRRTDAGGVEIPALASHVVSLELATTLGRDDVTVSTVEHLMAAIQIAGIDNLIIELDGPEVPILDGSSLPYCRLLEAAGTRGQSGLRRILAVTEPIQTEVDGRDIRIAPFPGLRVSYMVDFPIPAIGRQTVDVRVDSDSFLRELAPARTFAMLRDVEAMRQHGLGLGGNEDNCVVFDENAPVNANLRFDDEPVRHKALDAVGDLALLGCPLWAHLEVEKGGHLVHFKLIEALLAHPESWTWVRAESSAAYPEWNETEIERDHPPAFPLPAIA